LILLEQLKKIDSDQFIGIMESLSDPIRINILELMMGGEICVCDIVKVTGLSQSKISYHIKSLRIQVLSLIDKKVDGFTTN